jgi:hypothetical protein
LPVKISWFVHEFIETVELIKILPNGLIVFISELEVLFCFNHSLFVLLLSIVNVTNTVVGSGDVKVYSSVCDHAKVINALAKNRVVHYLVGTVSTQSLLWVFDEQGFDQVFHVV